MKQYEIEITRKYIVFVDAETEDEAIEQAETNYAEMTHGIADDMWTDILSVDGTPYETKEDYWLVSRWCDEDIANALECCDYDPSTKNIDLIHDIVSSDDFKEAAEADIFERVYACIHAASHDLTPAPEETITGLPY
ncbi:MAG: hypothetical protein IKY91_05555 [Akkermansia sp.]|nr:hypothetical protein [Akkermansia sp.]